MDTAPPSTLMVAAEVTLWAIPSLLALLLARRCPVGERRPWAFIASACGLFAVDEIFDILGRGHQLLQHIARFIDPGSLRGETLIWRIVLLVSGALIGLATMLFLFRGGRPGGRESIPRWIAFTGLCTVVFYVIFRFVPQFRALADGPTGWGILGVAWCLLVGGAVLEFERMREARD